MSKAHHDLSPHIETPQELYAHLEKDQQREFRRLYFRFAVASLGLIAGLRFDGDWSLTGYWLAFFFGFSTLWSMSDLVLRNWFMHAVSLRHLLHWPDSPTR